MPGPRSAKKTTPSKEKSAPKRKAAGQKYAYTELDRVSLTSTDRHHVYGVIVDASFPYKANKSTYVCSLKIIDQSLNNANKGENNYATVVIYAQRFEDLPIVHRIGDIIRLHRVTLRLYNNTRQFNCTIHQHGSWALFSTDRKAPLDHAAVSENAPFAFSGKHATFEKHEVNVLAGLKKWAASHFSANDVISKDMYQSLKQAKSRQDDFDVVAKVLQVFEMDEYTNELKVKDASGDVWYVLALKLKFPHLRQGAVVRIRSATWDETSQKKVLTLQHYSNIMTFISSSKLAASLAKSVSDDRSQEKAALKSDVSMSAVVLSEVDKKHQNLPHTSLNDLFHHAEDAEFANQSTFRTQFAVQRVEPADVSEFVKVYDKKSKKASSAKGAKGGQLIWQVQLLVKDVSTQSSNNAYRVLVYSHEGLGENFFGKPQNLHSSAAARAKVEDQVASLTRFNSWVDAVVERRNGYYFIKDTRLVL